MTPKVSVIIITYNQVDTIKVALDSVLSQKCNFGFEIVLGDDASTDGTRQVCEKYARDYTEIIRLMPKYPNKGLIDNYFGCMMACRGEYVTDCAGDDSYCNESKLQLMADLLDSNPEVNVVFSDWIIKNLRDGSQQLASSTGFNLPFKEKFIDGDALLMRNLNHIDSLAYNLSASMFRRESLMRVYREAPDMIWNNNFACEDLPVMAALASVGKGSYLDVPTIIYNICDDSVSNTSKVDKLIKFYSASLYMGAVLAAFYGVKQEDLSEFYHAKSDYIVSLAFNSMNCELRDIAKKSLSYWQLTPDFKVAIQLKLMESHVLWTIGCICKRLLKKVFHRHAHS